MELKVRIRVITCKSVFREKLEGLSRTVFDFIRRESYVGEDYYNNFHEI